MWAGPSAAQSAPAPSATTQRPTASPSVPPTAVQAFVAFSPARTLTVRDDGVAARFYEPTADRSDSAEVIGAPRQAGPAVLVLNGSNGGYPPSTLGRALADAGHPTLLLAYFSGPGAPPIDGLPARLQEIPLEYVDRAVDWLRKLTGRQVVLMGESRGAELALLQATRRADIAGVVAFAPADAVWQAPTATLQEPARAAWTVGGRSVPYLVGDTAAGLSSVERFARVRARGAGPAALPVGRIRGPVLLVAGDDDRIWAAGAMADSLAAAARRAGGPVVTVRRYPDAGHLLMGPGPGRERFVAGSFVVEFGGSAAGNRTARDDAWAHALAFLRAIPPGS